MQQRVLPRATRAITVKPVRPIDRTRLPIWEVALVLAAIFIYWNDSLRLAFPGTESTSIAFRAIHFSFYAAFCALIARDLPGLHQTIRQAALLAGFLALPVISTLWSIEPQDTFQRAIAVLGSSLLGVYIAMRLKPIEAMRLLGKAATLSAAVSIVLIFFFPAVGLMSEGEYVNVWSGAHIHKNGLGQMTALGAMICLITMIGDGVRRNMLLPVGLALNLFLLAGSRSLTAQIVFVAGVVMLFTIGRCLRFAVRHALLLGTLVAPLVVYAAFTLTLDDALALLASAGKDPTMSSRLPLWQLLGDLMEGHWLLGQGYEAFWTEDNYAVRIIQQKLHFKPHYSHNGFFEIWLAFGLVGIAGMASLIAVFVSRTFARLYNDEHNPLYLLCLVYGAILLLQNMAEATILARNHMSWTLFVLLYIYLAQPISRRPAVQEFAFVRPPTVRALPPPPCAARLPVE
jgi:exopolysaccharide production protein ExoQ